LAVSARASEKTIFVTSHKFPSVGALSARDLLPLHKRASARRSADSPKNEDRHTGASGAAVEQLMQELKMSIAVSKYHNSAFDGNLSLILDHIKDVPIWVAWQ
jgi:hypothetical protein